MMLNDGTEKQNLLWYHLVGATGISTAVLVLFFCTRILFHRLCDHYYIGTSGVGFIQISVALSTTSVVMLVLLWWLPWTNVLAPKTPSEIAVMNIVGTFPLCLIACAVALGFMLATKSKINPIIPYIPLIDSVAVFTSVDQFDDRINDEKNKYQIHGKILIVNFDSYIIMVDSQRMLPSQMSTFDPNEVSFVVGLRSTGRNVGEYTSGHDATLQGYTVEIIDLDNKTKVGTATIWGSPPPHETTYRYGVSEVKGELPDPKAIVDYIMTLPYIPVGGN